MVFNANITNNRFESFSLLDYDATTYNAAWRWSLGSKLNGAWSAERSQTLNSYEDIRTNVRNLKTVYRPKFNADWWFQSDWHLLGGIWSETSTSTVTNANNLSYRTETAEWGFRYSPADKNSIVLLSRNINGNYIDVSPDYVSLLDTGYVERQDELQFNWQMTGKSALKLSMMNIARSYPVFSQRDYSSTQRGMAFSWNATGKINVDLSLNNSVNPWFADSSSYFETNSVTFSSGWGISPKINMQISSMHSTSDYRNPVVAGAITRNDESQSQQIGFGWYPQQSLRLNVSYVYSQRASSYPEFEFNDNSTSLTLQAIF